MEGPFEITKVIRLVTYQLKLPATWKIHPVFHATLLRQYNEMDVYGANFPRPPPDLIKGEEVYEVEWILKHRKRGRGYQYYVAWKGYPILEASWEPENVFSDNSDLLTKYKLNHHLWIPLWWSNCPYRRSKIWWWSWHGDWMIVWNKPDRPRDSSNGIKTIWQLNDFQKPHSPSSYMSLASIFK